MLPKIYVHVQFGNNIVNLQATILFDYNHLLDIALCLNYIAFE